MNLSEAVKIAQAATDIIASDRKNGTRVARSDDQALAVLLGFAKQSVKHHRSHWGQCGRCHQLVLEARNSGLEDT